MEGFIIMGVHAAPFGPHHHKAAAWLCMGKLHGYVHPFLSPLGLWVRWGSCGLLPALPSPWSCACVGPRKRIERTSPATRTRKRHRGV